jgi:hypothetical protein
MSPLGNYHWKMQILEAMSDWESYLFNVLAYIVEDISNTIWYLQQQSYHKVAVL